MPKALLVNLVVADLKRSMDFFKGLGFSFNEQFTNDQAAALVISDSIYAMLHTGESIKRFTKKEIVDSHKATEVLLALQVDNKELVDDYMKKALEAGGKKAREPKDHGFMYEQAFEDPDGHIWEVFWMDPANFPDQEKIT